MAALRDDRERAVHMLRRAFADGLAMEQFIHTDSHWPPRALHAIMRPRG